MKPAHYRGIPVAQRLEMQSMPEPNSGCWLWTGALFENGYGAVAVGSTTYRAHRVSYETYKGKIPKGLLVCHRCDVRSCINPDHLFVGTHSENMLDSVSKGRHSAQNYKNVEARSSTKLSLVIAQDIRQAYAAGGVTMTEVAKSFGASKAAVWSIVNGKRWVRDDQNNNS